MKFFVGDLEFYLVWKNIFKEVMKEIDVLLFVEFDFMIYNFKG